MLPVITPALLLSSMAITSPKRVIASCSETSYCSEILIIIIMLSLFGTCNEHLEKPTSCIRS